MSAASTPTPLPDTLMDAILVEAEKGAENHRAIAIRIIENYPAAWLRKRLVDEAELLLARYTQVLLGRNRHQKTDVLISEVEQEITPGESRLSRYGAKFLEAPIMVPNVGIKSRAQLTADDCRALASDREEQAVQLAVWAKRFRAWAVMIDEQKAGCLARVDGWQQVLSP